jgi:hypothetical protein
VRIVGAGPGAPDLLTLRAASAIEQAEVLVWTDSLVSPQIAALAPEGCERIRTSSLTLEQVMEVVLQRAAAGKRVVRLHDGDPCLYGALAEQVCRLADAGIAVEVVPGVSAYQATAAALGSELTIPGLVQTIVLSRAGGRTGVPERAPCGRGAGGTACVLPPRNPGGDRPSGELARPVAHGGAPYRDGGHQSRPGSDSYHSLCGESGLAGTNDSPLETLFGRSQSSVPRRCLMLRGDVF